MYNATKRSKIIAAIIESGSEEAKKLLAAMQSDLYPMAPVVTYTATGRRFLEYRSVEGGHDARILTSVSDGNVAIL